MTPTEIYLWSGITVLIGFCFLVYMWLKPLINAKFKYLIHGGMGTLNFSKSGALSLNVQKPSKDETVMVRGMEKVLSTDIPIVKFIGIPCQVFVADVPTPVNIFEGAEKYTGVSDRELDTHAANMTNDSLKEFWMNVKNIIIILLVVIIIIQLIDSFGLYKIYQLMKDFIGTFVTPVSQIIAPTI